MEVEGDWQGNRVKFVTRQDRCEISQAGNLPDHPTPALHFPHYYSSTPPELRLPKIQEDAKPLSTSGNFTSGQNSDETESRAFGGLCLWEERVQRLPWSSVRKWAGKNLYVVVFVISQAGMKERGGFFFFFSFSNRHELFIIYRSIIKTESD